MISINGRVHRIEVPTPFPVGPVNCYLIEGHPLTIVDTGPKTSKSLVALQQGLQALSYNLSDIEQILLTHSHVDHVGMVTQIAREREQVHGNLPEVWVHQRDAEAVVNYSQYTKHYTEAFFRLVVASGVRESETTMPIPKHRAEFFKQIGESFPSTHTFNDGDVFKTGIGNLSVFWVPGHSPGSTCFVCDEERIIFSGDHILRDISSNPSISFDDSDRIGMLIYLDSLDYILSKDGYVALPGHREPVLDIEVRINALKTEYTEKLQKAASFLTKDPQTIYEMSRTVYGNYEPSSLVLALAETYDLLRILESNNQAKLLDHNGVVHVIQG
jgi:glyoxylase-like metal-dependent hydrolase (beta-lactamase superfamily II)